MRTMSLCLTLMLYALMACGGSEGIDGDTTQIRFIRHRLVCAKPGLSAKLQALGQDDCNLDITNNNTVQGVCDGFTSRQAYQLRLVYYTQLPSFAPNEVLELATATSFIDLTGLAGEETLVIFEEIDNYPDDDADGVPNISEWCADMNPRGP